MENISQRKRELSSEKPKQLVSKNNGISLEDNRPQSTIQKKANNTGLPNQLKSGIENLSGHSMDDVKVHYNSSKPAQLNAHAYAQGTDIHVASGQEKHLPHEAWHVVQQKQGRVRPTMQLKAKVNINDDKSLEKEADVMGAKAIQEKATVSTSIGGDYIPPSRLNKRHPLQFYSSRKSIDNLPIVQRVKTNHDIGDLHYGLHQNRIDGYMNMPEEGGGVKAVHPTVQNPITVDQLNADSNITHTFDRADGDFMHGYFDVIDLLNAHAVVGAGGTKTERWLDFLKANLDYLSIAKHVAQIQTADATAVTPTKDRLNKNGQAPAGILTNDGKRDAIVAAYAAHQWDPAHAAYNAMVSAWVWDVFFRRTSKLGIKFTVEENKVIHMNTYAPPRGLNPATRHDIAAANPVRARQPITHSEMRYINRSYGPNHANIDSYHHVNALGTTRLAVHGEMGPYRTLRANQIQNSFLAVTLAKTNLPGWGAKAGNIFRSRPTGVSDIRTELRTANDNSTKLVNIRRIANPKIGVAGGRHADTRAFYILVNRIPANIDTYGQAGTSIESNNNITNSIKNLTPQMDAFTLT